MTDHADRARKLLEAAMAEDPPACRCSGRIGYGRPTHDNPCAWFTAAWNKRDAQLNVKRLGFTPATLAVAITLADYAKGQDCETYGPHEECSEVLEIKFALGDYCDRCKALAEWGKLFPEKAP